MGYAYPVDSILTYIAGEPQYDRAVSSETLRSLYAAMMTNGIILRDSTNLQVVEDEGLKLKVKSGFCLMNGCMKKFDKDTSIELAAAEAMRVDTIVARLNLNQEVRDITIEVIQGTGTEPPALVREGDIYDLGLANVTVNAGAVTIAQADINDTRLDTERCGIISSISEFDTKTLYDQMNDSFYTWFEGIKGKLGDDVAGNLQLQIDGLADDIDTLQEDVENITPRVEALEKRGSGLAPYPVTNVKPEPLVFTEGIETGTLKVSWTEPVVYDIQVDHYNIYGYVGDTTPTDMSDFTLVTTTQNTSIEADVSNPYNYVLVVSVSTDGIVQENLSQMATVTVLNVPVKGITLENATWEQINSISEAGLASEYFSIGDTKSISINGASYYVKIYDFDHDDKYDGSGKAGITFGLSILLSSAYKMNNSNTNNGGWHNCVLRTTTLRETIYNQLDDSVRKVIKTVTKKTSGGLNNNNALYPSPDTLFLFSEIEVFGYLVLSVEGEGTQYPIFTDSTSRQKTARGNATKRVWWVRSPIKDATNGFRTVTAAGEPGQADATYSSAYVCFGFCV